MSERCPLYRDVREVSTIGCLERCPRGVHYIEMLSERCPLYRGMPRGVHYIEMSERCSYIEVAERCPLREGVREVSAI